jgi:ribosomal protein S13
MREKNPDLERIPEKIIAELRFNQEIKINDFDKEIENFLKSQSLTEEEKKELSQFLDEIKEGLTTEEQDLISHYRSIAEWKGADEPRDKVMRVVRAHLTNILLPIFGRQARDEKFDEEFNKGFAKGLKDVAENAKNHKLTREEYEQISNNILEKIPENMKDKVVETLEQLRIITFEQEKQEE